jgi:hypothetical protein
MITGLIKIDSIEWLDNILLPDPRYTGLVSIPDFIGTKIHKELGTA